MVPKKLLVTALLVSGCNGAVPVSNERGPLIPKPDIQVGDRWIYWSTDYWTNEPRYLFAVEVNYARGDAILGVMRKGDGDPVEAAWTSSWNATVNEIGTVYTPSEALLHFPARVGSSYSVTWNVSDNKQTIRGQFGFSSMGQRGFDHERTVTVMAWEDVSVPAGTFRALRIEAKGSYVRPDNTAVSGLARNVIWYVPEANRWVKRTNETWFNGGRYSWTGEELLRYEPAPRQVVQEPNK